MRQRVARVLTAFAVAALLLVGTARASTEGICRQCHGDPPGGPTYILHHALFYSGEYPSCQGCHYPDGGMVKSDCAVCHGVDIVASHPSCLTCHENQIGSRRPIALDFMATSHHVQTGAPPTPADCQACHVTTAHMLGTVQLLSAEDGSTITYTGEAAATTFCLGCHDDNSKTATPFSDLRTPVSSDWNWDGKSVKIKYSTTEVVSSNKYPPTVIAPNMGAPYNTVPDVQRALSAHGNPGQNMANGTTEDARVPCLACHNSHGSPASPLLFSTNSYVPRNMEGFCWDCHTNDPASPQKAADYMPDTWVKDYFGDPRWGLNEGSGFTTNWMGSFAYKNSSFMSSHFYPSKDHGGSDWPRSGLTCTDCHDPHGVDPGLGDAKAYMVPLLKGTWLISPYKEDRAPLSSFASALRDGTANRNSSADQPRGNPDLAYNNTPNPGGGHADGTGGEGHEGFFIDDNTFGVYDPVDSSPAAPGSWRNVLADGQKLQMNRIAEDETLFAGLCLRCHVRTDLQKAWSGHGTVKGWGGAKRDLFPRSVVGSGGGEGPGNGMHSMAKYGSSESEGGGEYARGYRWGVDPVAQETSGYIQTDYHQFPCSKCHSPHASNMPRLLTTNCLDSKGNHTEYAKSVSTLANNCHSTQRNLAWNILTPWIQTEAPVKFTIIGTSNSGGTISPAGTSLVDAGTEQAFTMAADPGYAISDVKVDGVSQGAIADYTFANVTANHTINTTFVSTSANLTLVASAGSGGTISPSGNVSVAYGGSSTFTITPNSGYAISDVKVDNVSQGAISSYTFGNVKAAHTIAASFVVTRTITASAGTGGTISPAGAVPVKSGDSQTFTITPDLGYKINQVTTDSTNRGAVSTYTFTNVTTTHTISATFATTPVYTISASAGPGGTISPAGNVQFNSGSSQTYTITPGAGYDIADVTTDGISRGAVGTYAFTNVTADHTISATFSLKTYTLSASAGAGGTITPAGSTVVNYGTGLAYAIAPNAGYAIAGVKVDDVPQGPITSYAFTDVTANHTISATYTPVNVTNNILSSAAPGGTITPSGNLIIPDGGSQTFTIASNYGYAIADVNVDGVSQGAISTYTFTNVTANHFISVTYVTTIPSFVLTSSCNAGGTVSPMGAITVWSGGNQTYNIYPYSGYAIANVTVDGVAMGAISTYTFSNVTATHSIVVAFGAAYSLTASAGTGGTISPSGYVPVVSGGSKTFTVAANSGSVISNVTVDGVSQGAISTYTFTNITANHTISAAFVATYTLTASAGTGGTISPAGSVVVNSGSSRMFTIAADSGYVISNVTVDGASQGAISTYTFTNVTADHTISAAFVATYSLTASAGAGGTISPSGNVTVNSGGSRTFTIAANTGYVISDVTVDGASQGAIPTYTFANVTANHGITATFSAIPTYTITASAGTGGTISPSGSVAINSGGSRTFDIAADSGYLISNVTVDGASQGAISTYTFGNVTGNHTISASFTATYTLTVSAGTGGTITPAGSVVVNSGTNQTFTVAATTGYVIADVTVDGASQGAAPTYTFTNVTADHTISATFVVEVLPNIALNKTATASSQYSSTYAASKAVDGSTSTYWRSSSSGTQWLRVDLGSIYYVSNVKGSWSSTYYARSFQIQTSLDGTTFTTRYSTTSGTSTPTDATFAAVAARYVRLYCTVANSSSYRVTELGVYGTPAPNQPPAANAGSDKAGTAGAAISFTGSGTDADGTIAGYSWNWGDSTANANTQNASHTYATVGTYTATLTVTDNQGATGSDTAVVTINPNQPPVANAGTDKTGTAGSSISFTGSGTDADGTIAGYSWNWGDGTADTPTQNASHTYAAVGTYTATLTVTDNAGITGSDTAVVTVGAPTASNLAWNKTTNASTTRSGSTTTMAVDGTTSTSWNSNATGTQWVQVDLGSAQNVANVKVLWPATYYARSFQIQTSTDGTSFTQRYSSTTGSGAMTNATFTAVSARYVRVNCTVANSTYYGVAELEVYATPPTNRALNKTASASTTRSSSYPAAYAVNGSTSNSWMSSTTASAQWVRVDLGSSMNISNLKVVWPATYFAQAFQIQISPDGTTWTDTFAVSSGATGTTSSTTFTPVSTRYVRVYCTTRNNSSYYGVAELEVYQ